MREAVYVSVVMPVYNGEQYLSEAIESILAQTFQHFEFIIIDDGSTDSTPEILRKYEKIDNRIRVVHLAHSGLVEALNTGLQLSKGEYIARMDADDVSFPDRLQEQFDWMYGHPEVGICGSWIQARAGNKHWLRKFPVMDSELRVWLLFGPPFAHPSVMMRREVLAKTGLHYDPGYPHVEDYALWAEISQHTQMANLPKVLLKYRLHPQQTGPSNHEAVQIYCREIWRKQLAKLGLDLTQESLESHGAASSGKFIVSQPTLIDIHTWLLGIQAANQKVNIFNTISLNRVLGEYWFAACQWSTILGIWTWKQYWRSPFNTTGKIGRKRMLKFALKCLLAYQPKS